jgi:hypothetical protein
MLNPRSIVSLAIIITSQVILVASNLAGLVNVNNVMKLHNSSVASGDYIDIYRNTVPSTHYAMEEMKTLKTTTDFGSNVVVIELVQFRADFIFY